MNLFSDWKIDRPETFVFTNCLWSVTLAKKILIQHPRQSVTICPQSWLGLILIIDPATDEENVDLSVPVICVHLKKGIFPIDGWGRLKRGLELGMILPSVILDMNESSLVRLS